MSRSKRRIGMVLGAAIATIGLTLVSVAPANAYGIFHGELGCGTLFTWESSTIRYAVRHQFSQGGGGSYVEWSYSNGAAYIKNVTTNSDHANTWLTIGYDVGPYTQFNFYCAKKPI